MSTTELFERRRENLSRIIDRWIASQRFKTGKEICEYYGLSAAYVAQLLNSKRQIGEKTARELEQQLGLLPLCLDQQEINAQPDLESPVTALLYVMQPVEQELFQLKAVENASYQMPSWMQLQPDHTLIQVADQSYAPVLKSGWWLLCDQHQLSQAGDLVYVQLVNQLCLILELQAETEQELHGQSLDRKRQVVFQQQDIQEIRRVSVLLSPQQIQPI